MAVAKTSSLLAALIVLLAVLPSGVSGADAPTPAAARPSTILKARARQSAATRIARRCASRRGAASRGRAALLAAPGAI
jgi:hypothetical protein